MLRATIREMTTEDRERMRIRVLETKTVTRIWQAGEWFLVEPPVSLEAGKEYVLEVRECGEEPTPSLLLMLAGKGIPVDAS